MRHYRITLIMASLLILLFVMPISAQKFSDIYRENEEVILLLETEKNWVSSDLDNFKSELIRRLQMKTISSLQPMFPDAPSIESLDEIYGFKPRYDLRNFYSLLISPGEQILKKYGPFEFAGSLRDESSKWGERGEFKMKSVEPDLPLSAYPTASALSSSNCPDKNSSPDDRAWHLRNMKVLEAWKFSKAKGSGEKIGHPDTGYSDHIDLDDYALKKDKKNNFIEKDKLPRDPLPDPNISTNPGHGTATGSVIISRGEVTDSPPKNSEGGTTDPGKVTGVASKAALVPYRAIKSVVRFTYGNIEKAIYEAVNDGCSVISLSLGGTGHNALNAAMEYAIGNNVIIVAAAGNYTGSHVVYPAKYPFCIAVAANNIDDKPWDGSAYGKEVTVSAPGEAVWRAFRSKPDEETDIVEPSCGTSYSTASVAGVAALWLAHHKREKLKKQYPNTKLQFVFKRLLKDTARCPKGWDQKKFGSGIVNAEDLLKADPESVRKDAIDDYSEFKKMKRESEDENLRAIQESYNETWSPK